MNRLAKLRNELADVTARMDKLLEAAAAGDGRDLTPDEDKDYGELSAQAASLGKRIKREEEFLETRSAGATVIRSLAGDGTGEAAEASANGRRERPRPAGLQTEGAIGRIHDSIRDDPRRGFETPRDFLGCVLSAGKGNRPDPRLSLLEGHKVFATAGSDEQQTQADQYGGYLLPEAFLPEFLKVEPEPDPTGTTTKVPMQSPVVKIPARTDKNHTTSVAGGIVVTRREETGTLVSSLMQMEQVRLEATGLFGLSYASEELLQYSPMSFIAIMQQCFGDAFTFAMVNEKLNGTGAGEFMGILESPALIAVPKVGGQATATINITNVLQMRSQCWHYQNAVWLANHDTLPQIAQLALTGSGNAAVVLVFMPSIGGDVPDRLLGRPIIFTEYAQTLGSQGDLILVDWSQYLEGTLTPIQSAESIHVRFLQHERTFKFWMMNAGAPWWRSPLTPKNSSKQLSPFVTLQARP
jgi:HK97 family phage major capsid protein